MGNVDTRFCRAVDPEHRAPITLSDSLKQPIDTAEPEMSRLFFDRAPLFLFQTRRRHYPRCNVAAERHHRRGIKCVKPVKFQFMRPAYTVIREGADISCRK